MRVVLALLVTLFFGLMAYELAKLMLVRRRIERRIRQLEEEMRD